MDRNTLRVILALVMSGLCYIGTTLWYQSTKPKKDFSGHRQVVARLSDFRNEVQRKPTEQIIWESVGKNEDLFAGEAVRTTTDAEASLVFLKTGTTLHLKPESLVVLEETPKGLFLDFLKGQIFVENGSNITLKTGTGEVALNQADVSLHKTESGDFDIEVFDGKAEVRQGEKQTVVEPNIKATVSTRDHTTTKANFTIEKPRAGETIHLNFTRGDMVEMTWPPLPDNYRVTVRIGPHRKNLKELKSISSPGSAGQLEFRYKPGKWILQAVARSTAEELRSMPIPITIEPKAPPHLLEPYLEGKVRLKSPDEPVTFKWTNRHVFQSQIIQVAQDPSFRSVVTSETLSGKATQVDLKLPAGLYLWRVIGYLKLKDKVEPLASAPKFFTVETNWEVTAPELAGPPHRHSFSFEEARRQGFIPLRWKEVDTVRRYRVQVEKLKEDGTTESLHDEEVQQLEFQVRTLEIGRYRWRVSSINEKDGQVKPSPTFEYSILDTPTIEWAEIPNDEYEYLTPRPTLMASWNAPNVHPAPATYRFRVASEGWPLENAEWRFTKQPNLEIPVVEDGRYQVVVEALDAKGNVLAASPIKTFNVKPKPLLPPPKWQEDTPSLIQADNKGNVQLSWKRVEGAESYLVILENSEGRVLRRRPVSETSASFEHLKPGEYQVRIKSIDEYKREGEESQSLKIEVPKPVRLTPPRIKNLKVK